MRPPSRAGPRRPGRSWRCGCGTTPSRAAGRWATRAPPQAVDRLLADLGRLRDRLRPARRRRARCSPPSALDVPPALPRAARPALGRPTATPATPSSPTTPRPPAPPPRRPRRRWPTSTATPWRARRGRSGPRPATTCGRPPAGWPTPPTCRPSARPSPAGRTPSRRSSPSIGLAEPVGEVVAHSCSMALGNKGATWLQTGELVTNPYMGQMMPRCSTGVEVVWDGPPEPPADAPDPSTVPDAFRRQLAGLWAAYLDAQRRPGRRRPGGGRPGRRGAGRGAGIDRRRRASTPAPATPGTASGPTSGRRSTG